MPILIPVVAFGLAYVLTDNSLNNRPNEAFFDKFLDKSSKLPLGDSLPGRSRGLAPEVLVQQPSLQPTR